MSGPGGASRGRNPTKALIHVAIALAAVMILTTCVFARYGRELEEFMARPDIVSPDLSRVRDGTYVCDHRIGPIRAIVEVTVENHAIARCRLVRHVSGLGGPAGVIVDRIVSQQTLDVDAVTGATCSSMVILKTVQLALEKGLT